LQEKNSSYLSYDPKTTILSANFESFEELQKKLGENSMTISLTDLGGASNEYKISLILELRVVRKVAKEEEIL